MHSDTSHKQYSQHKWGRAHSKMAISQEEENIIKLWLRFDWRRRKEVEATQCGSATTRATMARANVHKTILGIASVQQMPLPSTLHTQRDARPELYLHTYMCIHVCCMCILWWYVCLHIKGDISATDNIKVTSKIP